MLPDMIVIFFLTGSLKVALASMSGTVLLKFPPLWYIYTNFNVGVLALARLSCSAMELMLSREATALPSVGRGSVHMTVLPGQMPLISYAIYIIPQKLSKQILNLKEKSLGH